MESDKAQDQVQLPGEAWPHALQVAQHKTYKPGDTKRSRYLTNIYRGQLLA